MESGIHRFYEVAAAAARAWMVVVLLCIGGLVARGTKSARQAKTRVFLSF